MRTPTHDERAAMALATAAIIGDKRAAERHCCSVSSIQGWRQRLGTDESLAAACTDAREVLRANWADEIPAAIISAVDFLVRATGALSANDPAAVEAVAKALDTLSMILAHEKMLDAHLAGQAPRGPAQPPALVAAKATGTDG
jgi:hypothetical protein